MLHKGCPLLLLLVLPMLESLSAHGKQGHRRGLLEFEYREQDSGSWTNIGFGTPAKHLGRFEEVVLKATTSGQYQIYKHATDGVFPQLPMNSPSHTGSGSGTASFRRGTSPTHGSFKKCHALGSNQWAELNFRPQASCAVWMARRRSALPPPIRSRRKHSA